MDPLAQVSRQEPAEVTLPGLKYETGALLLAGAVHRLPAPVAPAVRTRSLRQQEEKSSLLDSLAGVSPSLLAALDRTHRHPDHVGELLLRQAHFRSYGLEINPERLGRSGLARHLPR